MQNLPRSGSLWLLVVGLTLILAGMAFTAVLWQSYQRAQQTRLWQQTPCEIISSTIRPTRASPHSPTKFLVDVRYRYQFAQQQYVGSRIRRVDGPMGDLAKATCLREDYMPGQRLTCWVDPAAPGLAVLKHETRAGLYSIWFPLLFVLGGAKMAWDALCRLRYHEKMS